MSKSITQRTTTELKQSKSIAHEQLLSKVKALTNEYILSKVRSLLKEKLDTELFNKVLETAVLKKVSNSFPVFSFRVSLRPVGQSVENRVENYILSQEELLDIIQCDENSFDDIEVAMEMFERLQYRLLEKYYADNYFRAEIIITCQIGKLINRNFFVRNVYLTRKRQEFSLSYSGC